MIKRTGWGWAAVACFIVLCMWILNPFGNFKNINLGIDLQGGTELQYKLNLSGVEGAAEDVAEEVKDIISRRLDIYGLKEIRIAIEGVDRLVVTIPGGDPDSTRFIEEQIEKAGSLQLQLVVTAQENNLPAKMEEYLKEENDWKVEHAKFVQLKREWTARKEANPKLAKGEPPRPPEPEFLVRPLVEKQQVDGKDTYVKVRDLVLSNKPADKVDGKHIASAGASLDPDTRTPMILFSMDTEGAAKLGELTGSNKESPLAIVLDDQVLSSPNIKSRISSSGQITGDFTTQEVNSIVTILRGGSLPTKPELISRNTVGALLGKEAVESSTKAILVGLALVMASIALYYLFAGLVANFALAFNIMAVLAFVACFRQTLTLPGVAGILLTIGMAIDANILIFERVREERDRGKTLLQSLTTGYQRAFSVIFDSNLTTALTGIVLFNFGTGPIKGFAITLIAGIIISFISSLFVTRLIISFFLNSGVLKNFKMNRLFSTPSISFSSIQKPFLLISVLVIIGSWAVVIPRKTENYGIDFTGGARVGFTLSKARPRSDVKKMIDDLKAAHADVFQGTRLQELNAVSGQPGRDFILMTRVGEEDGDANSGDKKDKGAQSAEKVRDKIEEKLEAEGLLLPTPFVANWEDTAAADAGSNLVLDVNILDRISEFSPDDLREKVNEVLAADPRSKWKVSGQDAESESGLKVESCSLVSEKTAESPVTKYKLRFAAFTPSPVASTAGTGIPSRDQAEAAARRVFNDDSVSALCALSEPFPTVSTVGATVSSDLQQKAIVAFFISILGIVFYVSLRFEFYFGLAAIAALIHDVLISIGLIALVDQFIPNYPVKINLPEVAALLTIIGYSINDTIVVFDRIRENLKIYGKNKMSFRDCVDLSINQTLSRTILTSATTLMTVCALLFLGGEAVRGFAFTFLIGLIAGTYSSVFVASPILLMLRQRALVRKEEAASA